MVYRRLRQRVTGRESSVAASQPFFQQLADWSWYKHRILDKYLQIWVYHLARTRRHLAFIDACAGEGMYEDGQPGSPIIAIRWNDEPLLQRHHGSLEVHACGADPESAERLRLAVRTWAERTPPLVHVYNRKFESLLPELLQRTRSIPSFFFVDPYSLAPLQSHLVGPLLEDRSRGYGFDQPSQPRAVSGCTRRECRASNRSRTGEGKAGAGMNRAYPAKEDCDELSKQDT
jgi:hypothetical protein